MAGGVALSGGTGFYMAQAKDLSRQLHDAWDERDAARREMKRLRAGLEIAVKALRAAEQDLLQAYPGAKSDGAPISIAIIATEAALKGS